MLKLGCIADDFASALDLANNLVAAGMRVVAARGVPQAPLDQAFANADAVVIALNTRYAPSHEAVYRALNAVVWLKDAGAQQLYFCFSPTFDSRYQGENPGNIGPVMDSLMTALETDFSLICPAFPDLQCTVYKGHLFVGDRLLHDSGMQSHSLTPMGQSDLMQILRAQTTRRVERIDLAQVADSSVAVQERMAELRLMQTELALADATSVADLMRLGHAAKGMPLVAGSAGLAIALPPNFGIDASDQPVRLPAPSGYSAVVCGSCSEQAARQIQHFHAKGHPAMAIDPLKVAKFGAARVAQAAATWAAPLLKRGPVLLYSTADTAGVQAVRALLGVENADKLVTQCLAEVAVALVRAGVGQLLLAGSQTAQACLKGLGVRQVRVGNQVDSGAPWTYASYTKVPPVPAPEPAAGQPPLTGVGIHLCLKPGTVGGDDFFTRAFAKL